jgi:hypothetical protein
VIVEEGAMLYVALQICWDPESKKGVATRPQSRLNCHDALRAANKKAHKKEKSTLYSPSVLNFRPNFPF